MVDEPDLVALLYRADWTRLSLSAQVHEVVDWALKREIGKPAGPASCSLIKIEDLPPMERDPYEHRARLRVAPGGRYRIDILPAASESEDGDGDEDPGGHDRVLRSRYGTRPGMPPPYPEAPVAIIAARRLLRGTAGAG